MDKLVASITRNGIPVVGFVNESRLYQNGKLNNNKVEILHQWVDGGLELGNHTWSHISLSKTTFAPFKKAVIRGETLTTQILCGKGQSLRYFRYPILQVGSTLEQKARVEQFLARRGYTIAPVTVNNADWVFALAYNRAHEKKDTALTGRVVSAYLTHLDDNFKYYEDLALKLLRANIHHVLVLHANSLNADHFDKVVDRIGQRGYQFISLEKALQHKAYESLDTYAGSGNDSWLHHWLTSVGLRPLKAPEPPLFIRRLAGPKGYNRN